MSSIKTYLLLLSVLNTFVALKSTIKHNYTYYVTIYCCQ
jgi:hypothetical protein